MDLNEMNQEYEHNKAQTQDIEFTDAEVVEDQKLIDLRDSLELLKKCKTYFEYLTDPVLCKTFTKRERTTCECLAMTIAGHVEDIEPELEEYEV